MHFTWVNILKCLHSTSLLGTKQHLMYLEERWHSISFKCSLSLTSDDWKTIKVTMFTLISSCLTVAWRVDFTFNWVLLRSTRSNLFIIAFTFFKQTTPLFCSSLSNGSVCQEKQAMVGSCAVVSCSIRCIPADRKTDRPARREAHRQVFIDRGSQNKTREESVRNKGLFKMFSLQREGLHWWRCI